jgi:branched-chain amino acid transport system ATP-binding protein
VGEVAAVGPLLQTVALQKTFGGLEAVRSVDFRITRGEIRAIIGPNGAGKTTLLSLICGRIPPTSGRVLFKGQDITHLRAHDRAARGILYAFQLVSIFKNLTVDENVALSAQRRLMESPLRYLTLSPRALADRVDAALTQVGLHHVASRPAGSLPYGHQRLVEVAMTLAAQPEVLALDEPTQGLAPEEIAAVCALITRISRDVTVLLIEHNMQVVLGLSQRVTVMDRGRIIAEGTPREIEANPEVQRVYLGL